MEYNLKTKPLSEETLTFYRKIPEKTRYFNAEMNQI